MIISISNAGQTVSKEEENQLFHHSFRGKNATGKVGFGLGLVLAKKIMDFHSGDITYSSPEENLNVFDVIFDKS